MHMLEQQRASRPLSAESVDEASGRQKGMNTMKRWIGYWLMGVAVLHTVYAVVGYGDVLRSIAARGVVDTVGADPLSGAVAWFVLFGVLLFACGLAVAALEKAEASVPRSLGGCMLALTVLGVALMPASGFWLAFPPAIALLARGRRA